jgi:hypothetical protein
MRVWTNLLLVTPLIWRCCQSNYVLPNYLSNRSKYVPKDGALSAVLSITSGVVQGSVPFAIFHVHHSCRVHLNADDVQIYISCELIASKTL